MVISKLEYNLKPTRTSESLTNLYPGELRGERGEFNESTLNVRPTLVVALA
jgi:hypothetical protein